MLVLAQSFAGATKNLKGFGSKWYFFLPKTVFADTWWDLFKGLIFLFYGHGHAMISEKCFRIITL